jgi:hypothetical protein
MGMISYEIHTYRDGSWKIDSIFDDRGLATLEARRMDETGRFSGLKVIEENYDDASGRTTSRTIYRDQKTEDAKKARLDKSRAQRAQVVDARQTKVEFDHRRIAVRRAKQRRKATIRMFIWFVVLVLVGLGGLIALQVFRESL